MSYTIQAFIALQGTFNSDLSDGLPVIRLDHGVEMVPIGDVARQRYGIPFLPLTDVGSDGFLPVLLELCSKLGAQRSVAYIEAEFFGGNGAQAHILIPQNADDPSVKVSDHAINDALAWLGVQPGAGKDRFDAVGLGAHRDTDGWLPGGDQ